MFWDIQHSKTNFVVLRAGCLLEKIIIAVRDKTVYCVILSYYYSNFLANKIEEEFFGPSSRIKYIIFLSQYAKLITHWVGLRPGRERVRLEPEERRGKLYIHNYGHGKYYSRRRLVAIAGNTTGNKLHCALTMLEILSRNCLESL